MTVKILVVDDKEYYRELLSEYFISEGFLVDSAKNALEAKNKFINEKNFNLVSTDCKMPNRTGLELISDIKIAEYKLFKNNFSLYTPVIMVTGSSIDQKNINYPESRFFGVIEKKVNFSGEPFSVVPSLKELFVSGLESAVYQHELAKQRL